MIKMAIQRPSSKKNLCGLYNNTRRFAHRVDSFVRDYGAPIGQTAQALALQLAAGGLPQAGLVTGAVGKGLQTYAEIRNQMG